MRLICRSAYTSIFQPLGSAASLPPREAENTDLGALLGCLLRVLPPFNATQHLPDLSPWQGALLGVGREHCGGWLAWPALSPVSVHPATHPGAQPLPHSACHSLSCRDSAGCLARRAGLKEVPKVRGHWGPCINTTELQLGSFQFSFKDSD